MIHILGLMAAIAAPQGEAQALPPSAATVSADKAVTSYEPAYFRSANPSNAMDMLERIPGFSLDTGSEVRGYEGAAGNVLIDGHRPATKTDDLEEILRRIPVSRIARIDVIRGGAPGIDMQGKSVLANVIKTPGTGLQGLMAVAGNFVHDGRKKPSMRMELSGGTGDQTWETSARYGFGVDDGSGDGPGIVISPSSAVIQRSDIQSEGDGGEYNLTAAFSRPLAGGKLKLNAKANGDKFKFEEDQTTRLPSLVVETTDDVYETTGHEGGANFTRNLGPRTSLELVGLHSSQNQTIISRYRAPGEDQAFGLDRDSSETIGRGVIKFKPVDSLSLEAGTETAINRLESQTRLSANGSAIRLPAANVEIEEKRAEAFVRSTWKVNPALTVEGGLNFETSRVTSTGDVILEKSLSFAKPRVSATWDIGPTTQLRARVEREVGQLDFDNFVASSSLNTGVVSAGNPALNPDQTLIGELTLEQRFWDKGSIVVTASHARLTDVVDRAPIFVAATSTSPARVFDAPSNIGDGTHDRLSVNLTLPLDRLGVPAAQLKTSATWHKTEVIDPTTHEAREISGQRPLDWDATFTQDLPGMRTSWGLEVYGGWRKTSYKSNEIETYKLKTFVKPFLEWKPTTDISVRFELPNVTERGFRNTREVFAGPRGPGVLATTYDRDLQFGRMYYVRLRRTFGG